MRKEYRARRLQVDDVAALNDLPERQISDGADPQGDNDARASFAGQALAFYTLVTHDYDEDPQTVMTDLLADLRHLSDALGVDFDYALSMSDVHYSAELVGEL